MRRRSRSGVAPLDSPKRTTYHCVVSKRTQHPPAATTEQIALRLPKDLIARADALRTRLGPPGLTLTRTDALRVAITRGLDELEQEQDA
jgi:hypothetical protein